MRTTPSSTNLVESALSFFEAKGIGSSAGGPASKAERWVGMALLYAESRFHRLRSYRLIPMLQETLHRDLGLEETKPQPVFAAG